MNTGQQLPIQTEASWLTHYPSLHTQNINSPSCCFGKSWKHRGWEGWKSPREHLHLVTASGGSYITKVSWMQIFMTLPCGPSSFFLLTTIKTGITSCLATLAYSTIFQLLFTINGQTLDVGSSGLTYLSQLWSGRSSLSPSPGWWGNQLSSPRLEAQCGSTPWWPMSCWARRCRRVSAWQQSDRDAKPGHWVKDVVSRLVSLL